MKELALHLLDIAENGITAGADTIILSIERKGELLILSVSDNGRGMDEETLEMVSDPFFTSRTTRKVGMGIPLFRQHAEMTGGSLEIESQEGVGTKTTAIFNYMHPDIQPFGDLEGCWILLSERRGLQVELKLKAAQGEFEIGSKEVREMLEVESLMGKEIADQLRRLIRNNIEEIGLLS